jgi:hypothetical protein
MAKNVPNVTKVEINGSIIKNNFHFLWSIFVKDSNPPIIKNIMANAIIWVWVVNNNPSRDFGYCSGISKSEET